jgi:uncharacterized protein (DUF983 family)
MRNAIQNIFQGTCPSCHKGKIFDKKGLLYKIKMPKMHENCTICDHKFEKEPGYFFGAMYVSYILTVAQAVGVYFILAHIFQVKDTLQIFFIIVAAMIGLSFFNMRISRIIWIHLFKN